MKPDHKTQVIAEHHQHIDNGGVSITIVDHGVEEGILLEIDAQYYGYPSIKSTMNIETLGPEWLEKIGTMFIGAAKDLSKIDWDKRYNEKKVKVIA